MSDQLFRRNPFPHMLGFIAVALAISAMSVHPQSTSPSDTSSGGSSAMRNQSQPQSQPVTPAKGNQSSTGSSGTSSTGAMSGSSDTGSAAGKVSASDRNLMRELAYANLGEIAAAKLAQTKSTN